MSDNILNSCFFESFAAAADLCGVSGTFRRGGTTATVPIVIGDENVTTPDAEGRTDVENMLDASVRIDDWTPLRLDELLYAGETYIVTGDITISSGLARFYAVKQVGVSRHKA
jgi:hypothetical protein